MTFHPLGDRPVLRYYPKLGYRTYEGAWTGLLGALVERSMDLALEPVSAHDTRHRDMHFVFPIAETMCNIYIRHQETSAVRDIFLAPFSPRLLACVVGVALVAAAAVVAASRFAPSPVPRTMGFPEALLWSTGILCQQDLARGPNRLDE
ncbi:Glutamate receptor U1 [Eumeta japonica]|uniref:Glutamate receptor U1 n=1 Tax=Eumeta variegata TaxID=151549 RepID=A0A4C1XLW8_EUMVA|nr:Glutamate receptor U1 [Eumeta japonica]